MPVSSQLPTESSLAQHLLVMIMGVAQTAVLCTAAQLGLADHLKDQPPKSVAALAEATGTETPLSPSPERLDPPGPLCRNHTRPVHLHAAGGLVANRCAAFAAPSRHAHGQ